MSDETLAPAGEMSAGAADEMPAAPPDGGDRSLLALIDRLTDLLNRSDLTELEVEAGETALVLRKPAALTQVVGVAAPAVGGPGGQAPAPAGGSAGGGPSSSGPQAAPAAAPARPSVKAPLTGLFYTSPSPGAPPYIQVGSEIAVGQVIGLIEAMKLFNEIKSDLAGRVVKICVESGKLVKAKEPLIEVEPL